MVKPEALHHLVDLHQNLVEFAPRPLSPFQFSFSSRFKDFSSFCHEHPIITSDLIINIIVIIIVIIIVMIIIVIIVIIIIFKSSDARHTKQWFTQRPPKTKKPNCLTVSLMRDSRYLSNSVTVIITI